MKLAIFITHPTQYFSPWFRYMAATRAIDLTVIYATEADSQQLGAEFGERTAWNIPLRDGYDSIVLQPRWHGDSLDATRAWSLDAPGLRQVVRDLRPDVGLITGWHSVAQLRALHVFRKSQVPILYRGDSTRQSMARGAARMLSTLRARAMLRRFCGFLAVGRRSREYLMSMDVAADRIFDSPHAVDNERFAAAVERYRRTSERRRLRQELGIAGDFVILFVGKLIDIKRPLDIIEAVARMQSRRVTVAVAGGGPLRDALVNAARDRGIDLRLLGVLDQQQLPRAYACADVLVLPSESETWGLVVNEAMACGVPCVVSQGVGCGPDLVVPGLTGEIVPVGDTAAIAQGLLKLRARIGRGEPVAERCRSHVSRFSFREATAGVLNAAAAVAERSTTARA